MRKIDAATRGGTLTAAQVNAALASVGLKPDEIGQLINNALLIASVNAAVDASIASNPAKVLVTEETSGNASTPGARGFTRTPQRQHPRLRRPRPSCRRCPRW